MTPPDPQQVAEIAGRLSKAQREAASGRYDGDFVSIPDATALERLGLWKPVPPDHEDEHWRFEATPLCLAVRNFIQGNSHD